VAYESGVPDIVDPLAGSYFIENLTDEIEENAWKLIHKIDAMGGSVSAIEQSFIQDEIARSAYEYQRNVESGEKIIVGVNKFQIKEEDAIPVFRVDDSIRDQQIQKLNELKERRNQTQVKTCLETIRNKAVSNENLMPAVIEAVESLCTLGEISDVLRSVFGENK
ncbi:MAG TPA: methylmalonyl-CoA mutase family protein, partial [Flavisolibacter sp.]|nr:methylmalonyl-CoA mutase family protein [Flavisolibacter sp.]